jgi:hypothetical protein
MDSNRVLVKMRPSTALRAAESRSSLRPLYDGVPAAGSVFGFDATPQWFIAELPEGAASPWDAAHARVADQLGVAESNVLFAEPDLIHDIYIDEHEERTVDGFGATKIECIADEQDGSHNKARGADAIWHLDDQHTQLRSARAKVGFEGRRTRIAHIDTGYFPEHITRPVNLREELARNFVEGDGTPNSAIDPNNELRFFDNSGHGTGTLSILAGKAFARFNEPLGGAPLADVVPMRVADSVVLLRTSALARALDYAIKTECDVITMSMGGLPTQAWAEAVDRVYEAGIVFCAAGGNRTRGLPPSVLVYPARYPRVIAVVGAMADGRAYKDLGGALEGSFGPKGAMEKALAAYTPNIPWARFGCKDIVRLNGEGTSSATPQVAAAAALWIECYKDVLRRRDWRRVEAVRKALFDSARKTDPEHFGNGILQALDALAVKPDFDRPMAEQSKNSFAFLRLITGLGITEPTPREEMFNLELSQLWLRNGELQALIDDPEFRARFDDDAQQRKVMDIVIQDPRASLELRRHIESRYVVTGGGRPPLNENTRPVVPDVLAACDPQPQPRNPPYRRLRVFAVDPSLSTHLATASINEVTLNVRWEKYENGAGEYLRIDDVDAAGQPYDAVNLNAPELLAQDGWSPAEGNAQFHQQMVYAVAMKTIAHFEKALGRPVLWRPKRNPHDELDDKAFVGQLTLRPHALRQANAYYSPNEIALNFGYFEAQANNPGEHMPGSRVYTCLAHDIIAHETTHAVLDGMHRRFNEATNPDVLAFHEAFADIVALMQHFTMRELLENQIAGTRGDIETESMLGQLAVQFGQAMGGRGALRSAIGEFVDGVWVRNAPDPAQLQTRLTPHGRGAILVAAVFDAFIAIYKLRTADLLRIYTDGTGVLRAGAIHPDLVRRLADEAAKTADRVLEMCIRALDYVPPIDVTFFEYLRALITADEDIVGAGHEYRVAFIEAFRRRGIYPQNMEASNATRTLSVHTLRWQGGFDRSKFTEEELGIIVKRYKPILEKLRTYAKEVLYIEDRKTLFDKTREHRRELHEMLKAAFKAVPAFAKQLGLDFGEDFNPDEDKFEVHSLRASMRAAENGRFIPQAVVVLTQSKPIDGPGGAAGLPRFRGGSTIVVDLTVDNDIKYRIVKNIANADRQQSTAAFVTSAMADPLRALLVAPSGDESFMALHSLADEGV